MTKTSYYERHGPWIAALGVLLLPFVVTVALRALATNVNEVEDWLPADYVETAEYRWFRQNFANDEFIIVTWEGCTLEDERLDRLKSRLLSGELPPDAEGQNRFARVVTGRSAYDELKRAYSDIRPKEAVEKLRGSLVGPDGRQTCAIVSLTDPARVDVHRTIAVIREAAADAGVPLADLRLGGPPVLNAAIDEISARSLYHVVLLSLVIVSTIAWLAIRDLRLMILILVAGLYSAALSLAMLWIVGQSMNAILTTMIPMVYVTATSGSIHLCNYYLEAVREGGFYGAAGRAVAHAWVPLGLATATTAAGLLSICYTDLTLIRTFGIFSAIGVCLSWLLLVGWVPAVLTVWKPRQPPPVPTEAVDALAEETGEAPLAPFWKKLGEWVVGRAGRVQLVCLAIFVACIPGVSRMHVTIDFIKEFRSDAEFLRTLRWMEEKLGSLMPMEVVVRMDESCPLNMYQRVRLIERMQRRMESLPDTGGSISAATYVPEVTAPGPGWLKHGILNTRLRKQRERLEDTGYLAKSGTEELWRITVRVAALREIDTPELLAQLRSEADAELHTDEAAGGVGIDVTYTGVGPVLYRARRSLVDGLFFGVATDLVLIVLTITVLMRHWSSGVLMALTSLFPTILVLGTVGWTGITIDMGAIMAPCVALGVTIDDVIHFLLWFRTGAQRGLSRSDSVMLAWRACVRPMYQSWSLLGLGMICLAISEFLPILQFGAIMMSMLTVGLLGNLFFLPSLLAGPLGGVIERRCQAKSRAAHRTPHAGTILEEPSRAV